MEKLQYLLLALIIVTDIIAIHHLIKWSGYSTIKKVLMAALIAIVPVIGISIYYSTVSISRKRHA